jgi:hypothetical protein
VFENRVLRRIFGPKRDEVTGQWRKLHSSQVLSGRSNQGERGGQGMLHAWERGEMCTGFWWESLRERPRHRWEDGIRMDLREIGGGGGVEWIHQAQDRDHYQAVMNAVMNLQILMPQS